MTSGAHLSGSFNGLQERFPFLTRNQALDVFTWSIARQSTSEALTSLTVLVVPNQLNISELQQRGE